MTRRLPTEKRRIQFIESTLSLLEEFPIEQVTTRRIAERVGVSQPALFRHFDNRDAIFSALVDQSRQTLQQAANGVLEHRSDWSSTVIRLSEILLTHVEDNPGLARLMFHDLYTRGSNFAGRPVAGLIDMQAGLVASIVLDGQTVNDVSEEVDPSAAGRLFIAVLQGAILNGVLGDRPDMMLARDAVRMWVEGVRKGIPAGGSASAAVTPTAAMTELDVRPLLGRGEEPLEAILEALQRTRSDGLLVLAAPFLPSPLLTLLAGRGYRLETTEVSKSEFQIEVYGPSCPAPMNLLDLEAPEPLEAILFATGKLAAEAVIVARVPRVPRLLLPRLDERGLRWQLVECLDGTALIHVRGAL